MHSGALTLFESRLHQPDLPHIGDKSSLDRQGIQVLINHLINRFVERWDEMASGGQSSLPP